MGKQEKLIKRFLSKPKDFTYEELKRLLKGFGYDETQSGKTSGSRVAFVNSETKHVIKLHKPHPVPHLREYQLDYVKDELNKKGYLP